MGSDIHHTDFSDEDFETFSRRLDGDLGALRRALGRPGFGEGPRTIGAELELSLVAPSGRPAPKNAAVLEALNDPTFTLELNRFNLELNVPYGPFSGRPFTALQGRIEDALQRLSRVTKGLDAEAIAIGILPSLQREDLTATAMSDRPRFRALNAALQRKRGDAFHIEINGADPLSLDFADVTPEGAATSWQWHLRVDPKDFAAVYNAAQLTVPLALAVASNSPLLVGHRLWRETRVALFKQAVDTRHRPLDKVRAPARVAFGSAWLEGGADALFEQAVLQHAPLLPECSQESEDVEGSPPRCAELRLHGSTVWLWNRQIYDPAGGGHVRLEQRALPAGPTVIDMLANTAFAVGLTLYFEKDPIWRDMDFEQAHSNFYRAAQHGLDAELRWPGQPQPLSARTLSTQLLDAAKTGLEKAGLEAVETTELLAPIQGRLENGITGAEWQLRALAAFEQSSSRDEAVLALVQRYRDLSREGAPVHEWPIPEGSP